MVRHYEVIKPLNLLDRDLENIRQLKQLISFDHRVSRGRLLLKRPPRRLVPTSNLLALILEGVRSHPVGLGQGLRGLVEIIYFELLLLP